MWKKGALWASAALLAAGPARSAELIVEPAAPTRFAVPAVPAAAALAVPIQAALSAAAPLAAPSAAAPAACAIAAAPAAAAEPFDAPASAPAPAAVRAAVPTDAASRFVAPDVSAGRALFDRAGAQPSQEELVNAHAARPLRGVFIQQEQEGSLLAHDPRDSSGDVFRYYRPVEIRPELAARVESGMSRFDKAVYAARRLLLFGRGGAEGAWRAWPLSAKLAYLDALDAAVSAERGPGAAWDGKVSLILEKTAAAPDYAAAHPHMEPPPDARVGDVGARFLQPEIVSGKEHPALTVEQALGRTRQVVAATGHAGTQYHVFVKADPRVLLAQMDRLDGALQLFNDVLFARAAAQSELNLAHASLMPWHRGRSERVRRLLEKAAAAAHVPQADDPDSEKHAFVGLRWWGLEDGKAVVSFELRGVSMPWARPAGGPVRGLEEPVLPKRDYSEARAQLTFVALYAEALARGRAPVVAQKPVVLDEAAADELLASRAKALGLPDGAFDGLGAFARRLAVAQAVPQGWLFAFAAEPSGSPRLRALADEIVVLAAEAKAVEDAGAAVNVRNLRYRTWSAYADWARAYADSQNERLLDMIRAAAR